MPTQKEMAAEVAREVAEGKPSSLVKFLFETLPKSAYGKIPAIEAYVTDREEDSDWWTADHVRVDGQPRREPVETVEAYGLRIELDAGGYATHIHCDRGFLR